MIRLEHGNHIDLPPLLPLLVLLTGAPMSTPAENLRKAAALLRERGWCQGVNENDSGCLCAIGAMCVSIGEGFDDPASVDFLEMDYFVAAASGVRWISNYNDTPGRTADEVIAVLEKAATLAEVSK